jgi:hypothetical protein
MGEGDRDQDIDVYEYCMGFIVGRRKGGYTISGGSLARGLGGMGMVGSVGGWERITNRCMTDGYMEEVG